MPNQMSRFFNFACSQGARIRAQSLKKNILTKHVEDTLRANQIGKASGDPKESLGIKKTVEMTHDRLLASMDWVGMPNLSSIVVPRIRLRGSKIKPSRI
jgi:hypothetical protein